MPRMMRFRFGHLLTLVFVLSLLIWYCTGPSSSSAPTAVVPAIFYCPPSTSRIHVPTVILSARSSVLPSDNRTHWLRGPGELNIRGKRSMAPVGFVPYAPPAHELRFAQSLPHLPARAFPDLSTSRGFAQRQQQQRPQLQRGFTADEDEEQLHVCPAFHDVPASPPVTLPASWSNSKIMFGMSTLPDRALFNIPVWAHWLPSTPGRAPLDPVRVDMTRELPLLLVLTPPPNPTERARMREAVDDAETQGLYVTLRPKESDRFETRYFSLLTEMWKEAGRRQTDEGVLTEWFVLADDDTFYPDFSTLARMLASLDSSKPAIIGALSESRNQVAQWGHIAYGGAGIYLSRALMAKLNAPGVWEDCLNRYGSAFGGDAMITHCAALVMAVEPERALQVEDTLHQLDIRGDGTGWFQSGFHVVSMHHWASWFTLFPPWHESGVGDLRKGVLLVGKAARAVGGDNWMRRYVFDGGKVVVSLGYSVVIHATPVEHKELAASEHTWWEFETFHPTRPGLEEALHKRTYYLTGVRRLDKGVIRMEHRNRERERIDIIWDARAATGWS